MPTFEDLHDRKASGEFTEKTLTPPPAGLLDRPQDDIVVENGVERQRTSYFDDGRVDALTEFDANGLIASKRTYEVSESGEYVQRSAQLYVGGVHHDPDPQTPSFVIWKNGEMSVAIHHQHGVKQDPAPGLPAFRVLSSTGADSMAIHYAGGKMQDPAPGKPAHVMTLENGMVRSTFVTQDIVTEQQDSFPIPNNILPGNLIVTRKAAE